MEKMIVEYDDNKFKIQNGVLLKYLGNDHEVHIPYGVTEIASRAFDNNSSIVHVYVPDTVKSTGERAFINCHNLLYVYAPSCGVSFIHCELATSISRYDYYEKERELKKAQEELEKTKEELKKAQAELEKAKSEPKFPAYPVQILSETDYKQLFLEIAYMTEPAEKENILDRIFDEDVKIPFAVHLFICYESQKAKQYITENSNQVMHYLVNKGDMNSLDTVLQMIKNK